MKIIKGVIIGKIVLIVAAFCVLVSSIDAMKPTGYTKKSVAKRAVGRQVGLENVWVKTSGGQVVPVPLWQIEQMTVLYEKFVEQNGTNSLQNPLNAPMISSGELQLLQKALEKMESGMLGYEVYDPKLTILAGEVGAHSLSALLVKSVLPKDIQVPIVLEIIKPVVSYLENPKNSIITLQGHNGIITCLAFSLNGKFFVSGSRGEHNNLIMWDALSLQQINILSGHPQAVTCAAISPDSQYIVSGSLGGFGDNLILWNVATKKFKKLGSKGFSSLTGHNNAVNCVAFSPDGKFIVSGSAGSVNNLIVWNVQTKKQKYVLDGHRGNVMCVAWSYDGKYIASGGADNTVMLWNAKSGELIHIFKGHGVSVICLAFDYNSTKIISGSAGVEHTLFSWDIATKGAKELIVPGATGSANSIVFTPDKQYFFVGGSKYLVMFDAQTEAIIHQDIPWGVVKTVAVSNDSCCCAAGTYGYKDNVIVSTIDPHKLSKFTISSHTNCLAFNPYNSDVLIIGSEGVTRDEFVGNNLNCLKIYDPQALEYIATKLTVPQAYFVYRLYKALLNKDIVILDERDQDFGAYDMLPLHVKKLLRTVFPFQVVEKVFPFTPTTKTFVQMVAEKKNTYKPLFEGMTVQEKIAKLKQIMSLIADKSSVEYKAAQEILDEIEAFEV